MFYLIDTGVQNNFCLLVLLLFINSSNFSEVEAFWEEIVNARVQRRWRGTERTEPRPIALTYDVQPAPVWSNISSYNYRRLQISQSKCLPVIGNYPRRTPTPCLHTTLNVTPIRDFIYHFTANFFDRCSAHPNPFVRSIGNYSLADLPHQYKKYIHKRPKHILF